MRLRLWDWAGVLLGYPGPRFAEQLEAALAAMGDEERQAVAPWAAAIAPLSPSQREELYVRTFDLDPAVTLELGWHLFGEDYRRGEFLVVCRRLLRQANVPEAGELPDHLARLLPALAALPAGEIREFVEGFVEPGLAQLAQALAERQSPYACLLQALAGQVQPAGGSYERP